MPNFTPKDDYAPEFYGPGYYGPPNSAFVGPFAVPDTFRITSPEIFAGQIAQGAIGGSFTYNPPNFADLLGKLNGEIGPYAIDVEEPGDYVVPGSDYPLTGLVPAPKVPEPEIDVFAPAPELPSLCGCNLPTSHYAYDHKYVKEQMAGTPQNYVVTWEIDAEEFSSAISAAKFVVENYLRPGIRATVFKVRNKSTGQETEVDLDPEDVT